MCQLYLFNRVVTLRLEEQVSDIIEWDYRKLYVKTSMNESFEYIKHSLKIYYYNWVYNNWILVIVGKWRMWIQEVQQVLGDAWALGSAQWLVGITHRRPKSLLTFISIRSIIIRGMESRSPTRLTVYQP